MSAPRTDDITAILITLKIGREQSLFIRLTAAGAIDRLGTGSEDDPDSVLCRGEIETDLFHELRAHVSPALLAWCGKSHTDPRPRGKRCELLIGFQTATGEEHIAAWEYGSKSFNPPEEVYDFVAEAVRVTDPWWEAQRSTPPTTTSEKRP